MTPGRPVPPPLAKPATPSGTVSAGSVLAAAYGATSPDSGLVPLTLARRTPKADDVVDAEIVDEDEKK